jgi:hypothetical protein
MLLRYYHDRSISSAYCSDHDIVASFRKTLDEAEALLAERPLRTSLSQAEIDRIAEFYYATVLAADEDFTTEGHQADEDLVRSVARQLTNAGIEYDMPAPLDAQRLPYGLTNRQVTKRDAELAWYLPIMRGALARGDIGKVGEAMTELLDRFHLNVDPNSIAYRKLGLAVLRAEVRALEALERRSASPGASCWVQCPTPGSRTFFQRFGTFFSRLSTAGRENSTTASSSPVM